MFLCCGFLKMLMDLKILLLLLAGPCFLLGVGGYLFVRRRLRPDEKETEETYYEFEEQHPAFRRYGFWSRFTLGLVVLSMLLLFLAIAL